MYTTKVSAERVMDPFLCRTGCEGKERLGVLTVRWSSGLRHLSIGGAVPPDWRSILMRSGTPRLLALALAVPTVALGLPAVASAATGPNLVVNPGFDKNLDGWFASDGATLREATGRSGKAALAGSGKRTRTVVLNDKKNTVASTTAGTTYVASAWVRGSGRGVPSAIRIQEWAGDGKKGEAQTYKWLKNTSWHRIEVRYTARTTGASLDLNVVGSRMAAGRKLRVDDVSLVAEGNAPAPAPAPKASTPAPAPAPKASTPAPAPAPAPAPVPRSAPAPEALLAPQAVSAPSGNWRLVWADEFNGSSVDRSRWNVENNSTYGDGNNELACLMDRPENVSVSGGTLKITARKESRPVTCGSGDRRFPGGRQYTSGHLSTKDKAAFKYGRVEMRAKTPTQAGTSKGLWPAFWLRPTSGGTGELDVMEAIGSGSGSNEHSKVHQTIHYDYSGTHRKQVNAHTFGSGGPSDGMHTYAVEWEPGQIRWYIDNQLTYTRSTSDTPWVSPTFDKDFYLRLNMAVGGNWPGSPDSATRFPSTYEVDYVRVYQR